MLKPKLILASHSPRRRELLIQAGYSFEVRPPREMAESGPLSGESPSQLVARLAKEKAAVVAADENQGALFSDCDMILACDTVAECDGEILGKPDDEDHARQMLEKLSGQCHRVFSGLCLRQVRGDRSDVRVAVTILEMDRLDNKMLDDYLASGQWRGKAGAFGYQDRLGWVHVIEGSESNVVGLPMELLKEMLDRWRTG
jgi:septum formation protein